VVYGSPQYTPIDEKHPVNPQSPYGQTKLDFEQYLKKVANLKYVIFRYFNVAGSDPEGQLGKGDIDRDDLMGNVMKVSLNQKDSLEIYGDDYKTPDGTAIRDFLHVEDIANAHILALEKIDDISGQIYNLGSENGFSVREIIKEACEIIQREILTEVRPRRPGDVPISLASAEKAKRILGWQPHLSSLATIIETDWQWRKKHPFGYSAK
jgi:UDP-glucose 4-epimerase